MAAVTIGQSNITGNTIDIRNRETFRGPFYIYDSTYFKPYATNIPMLSPGDTLAYVLTYSDGTEAKLVKVTLQRIADSVSALVIADTTLWRLSGDTTIIKNNYKVYMTDSIYANRNAIPWIPDGEPVGAPLTFRKLNATPIGQLAKVPWPRFIDTLYVNGADSSYWDRSSNWLYPKSYATDSVGIGTNAPTERLDVNGNINIPATTADVGQIKQGGETILHTYSSLNGVPPNMFISSDAGNYTNNGYGDIGIGQGALHNLTAGIEVIAIGVSASNSNTSGSNNVAIGGSSLSVNETGDNNVAIGYAAGVSIAGDGNVCIGFEAGYNETGSDKLYIGGSRYDSPLIYGDFATNSLTVNDNLTVPDSIRWTNHIAQYHRMDSIDTPAANTWIDVKFDTLIASESTYGYKFNADSTGFIMQFDGVSRLQGCGHWLWTGTPGSNVKIYIRVLVEGVEARCLQANDVRGDQTSDDGTLPYTGTIAHDNGDEVIIQYRVSNDDMDWEGNGVFDHPVAFSINFEKINNDF